MLLSELHHQACDSWTFRGKIVLGYTEAELRVRGSGYQFIHAADMLYCAENHVRSKFLPEFPLLCSGASKATPGFPVSVSEEELRDAQRLSFSQDV